jgi:hypothetical protein
MYQIGMKKRKPMWLGGKYREWKRIRYKQHSPPERYKHVMMLFIYNRIYDK